MNHDDHVRLIAGGITQGAGGLWAEMGSGRGAFTLALRELAGPDVTIWSIDLDARALRDQAQSVQTRFPGTDLRPVVADMTGPLDLPMFDGIVAANAIHFVHDQFALLRSWKQYLKPDGRVILVEYDSDLGNQWVPYPISATALPALARAAGFEPPLIIARHSSRFLDGMYAAVLRMPETSGFR